jgi:threonine/homoserine/homoserine lactone efflux protein
MLAVLVLSSLTLWTLSGTALKRWITNPAVKKYINIFLSLLLVYTALSLLFIS